MSVFLSNVDDFILPSQACVNPIVLNKAVQSTVESSAKIFLQIEDEAQDKVFTKPQIIKTKNSNNQKVASVSLNDCLACR
jgi:hypothetical protein